MTKVTKSARLPPDQADAVEAFAEEAGITEAEAMRRIVRTGLAHVDPDDAGIVTQRNDLAPIPWVVALTALIALIAVTLL